MAPLSAVYRAAITAKNLAYERKWLQAKRLPRPVISVGNLSVGGSGKTPLTIRLAELLQAEGIAVNVLSRGYGRSGRATEQVDPAGSAERFGDEPLLIARRTGTPVFVGTSRYEAGLLAAEARPISQNRDTRHPHPLVHLLDDGFQHRQLARDVDIVLLHRSDFTERLLPAGRLREPLAALARADFIVLREEDAEFEGRLRKIGVKAPVWWVRRSLTTPKDLTETTERAVAFCSIARPDEFFSSLLDEDINVELTITFADHHRYSRDDVDRLVKTAAQVRADAFVITEKDAVKLDATLIQLLEADAPVRVVKLEVALRDEAAVIKQLLAKLPRS